MPWAARSASSPCSPGGCRCSCRWARCSEHPHPTWAAAMDIFSGLMQGFAVALTPMNLVMCFAGCFLGTVVGVLPGLGPPATIAMLLPLTFKMDPTGAMIMLAGIYYGAKYGGSTTSILLNVPGESASVVTCLDGYAMARKGRAGAALGIAAIASFVSGTVGVIGRR